MVTESDVKKMAKAKDVSGLIKLFEDENLRESAADAIIDIGKTAVDPLIEALGNKNVIIRVISAQVLGMIGDERAIEHLIKLFKDDDEDVRSYGAGGALVDIGKAAVKPLIEALSGLDFERFMIEGPSEYSLEPKMYSIQVLGKIGDKRAVEPLIEVLNDKDMEIVFASIVALGNIKDVLAVEPLIKKIEDLKDEPWGLRLYVTAALVKIGKKNNTNLFGADIHDMTDKEWNSYEKKYRKANPHHFDDVGRPLEINIYDQIDDTIRKSLLEGELGGVIIQSGLMIRCEYQSHKYQHACHGKAYFNDEIRMYTPTKSDRNSYMHEEGYEDDGIYCADCIEYLPSKEIYTEAIYHPDFPDLMSS